MRAHNMTTAEWIEGMTGDNDYERIMGMNIKDYYITKLVQFYNIHHNAMSTEDKARMARYLHLMRSENRAEWWRYRPDYTLTRMCSELEARYEDAMRRMVTVGQEGVDVAVLTTLGSLVRCNDWSDEEVDEILGALRSGTEYRGGGGACPLFVISNVQTEEAAQ